MPPSRKSRALAEEDGEPVPVVSPEPKVIVPRISTKSPSLMTPEPENWKNVPPAVVATSVSEKRMLIVLPPSSIVSSTGFGVGLMRTRMLTLALKPPADA